MPKKAPLPPEIVNRCRQLRKNSTQAEAKLWSLLRNRRLGGYKFRRQHPAVGYILDFYCDEARLAIEVDGGGHAEPCQAAYDQERSARLAEEGIAMVRFWNHEVNENPLEVMRAIWEELLEREEHKLGDGSKPMTG